MKTNDVNSLQNKGKTSDTFATSLCEILEYAHVTRKLCVYGAGKFARILYDFLRMKQQRIDIFLVSDDEPLLEQNIECIPIVHLSENPFNHGECNVILALDEKYIPFVQCILFKTGYTNIFIPGNDFFSLLYIYNYLSVKLHNIHFNVTNIKEKAKLLSEKYKQIVFHEILISRFGPMLMFLIQNNMRDSKKQDVLNVHIPMAIDYHTGKKFLLDDAWSANEYFYGYLKQKFLFASKHDVALWKTIIEEYPEKVLFSRHYSLKGFASYQQKKQNQISSKEYMSFHATEFVEKNKELRSIGIGGKYVCFCAREDNYFHSIPGYNVNESQSRVRNCSVGKFAGMSKYLKSKGYQSVRMGTLVNAPVDIPDVVDYAVKYRTEGMDFFLISQSKFVICQFSGFHLMAVLFNKPTILTDAIQMTVQGDTVDLCNPQQDIMLLKKIWSPYSKRLMTLKEILLIEEKIPNLFQRTNYYLEHGYKFIENTADEITGAVEEMTERLDGCIKYDEEYYSMQARVKEIRDASVMKSGNMYFDIPLGRHFLKTNRWLLE